MRAGLMHRTREEIATFNEQNIHIVGKLKLTLTKLGTAALPPRDLNWQKTPKAEVAEAPKTSRSYGAQYATRRATFRLGAKVTVGPALLSRLAPKVAIPAIGSQAS